MSGPGMIFSCVERKKIKLKNQLPTIQEQSENKQVDGKTNV